MKKQKYNRSFARRLTRWVMLVLFVMMSALGFVIYDMADSFLVEFSGSTVRSNMQSSAANISGVLDDVRSAVENNVAVVEEHLAEPDRLPAIMERVVAQNPRVRSCGVSFVESYYPQKGRAFCPYACRADSARADSAAEEGEREAYLGAEWFGEALAADSAMWSEPFYDGRYAQTPLVAYMHPIRDAQGRTVAILGADLSLDFMTELIALQDSVFQRDTWAMSFSGEEAFSSFVVEHDGTFVTHPDHRRILHGNFYNHISDADQQGLSAALKGSMANGDRSNDETSKVVRVDRAKTYLYYEPLAGIDWTLAVAVPTMSLNIIGIIVGLLALMEVAFVLMVTFFVCRLAIRRASAPLKQLAATADEVASGDFNAALPAIKSRDEIHLLRDSFENMQHSLTAYMDQLQRASASKASIERELSIAHNIQMAMLPKTYPAFPDRHDLDIYGQVTTAKAVGGDLYDFFIRDDKLVFCIGDVSGKGVPASLVMAVTRSLFRNIGAYTLHPEQIVLALNEALTPDNDTGMFATLFVGVLHLSTGMLCYSNAGHNPPLLLAGGGVEPLACDANIAVGVMPGWQFTAQQLQLQKGDTVFLYTDGLNEAEDATHQQFGMERVRQVARTAAIEPQRLIEALATAVQLFIGDAEQSDDLTMLAIQYKGT